MSDEKIQKEVKVEGKLEKQVANLAFTVRKIKDKLEEQLGMDIDGDGRVGSGPFKKALAFLLIAGMATFCAAENKTALAYWSSTTYIDASGYIYAPYFSGNGSLLTSIAAGGVALASNKVLIGSSTGVGAAQNLTGDVTISTSGNVTIGDAKVHANMIDPDVVTNVLSEGMVLPAVDGSAVTNIVNAGIASVSAAKLTAATVATAIDAGSVTNLDLSKLKAGVTAAAFNGSAITALSAANITSAGTISAINGASITNITAANVGTISGASAVTNLILVSGGTTNTLVLYPFGGGYIIKSSTAIP